jgi:TldD protein
VFSTLDSLKPALRQLVRALGQRYPYASALAVEDASRRWSISRGGVNIDASGFGGGTGFVLRVFDGVGCAEYSFNRFSEEMIPEIEERVAQGLAAQNAALEGFAPLPTPIPADEPASLCKATVCRVDPRELGDEAILARLRGIREKALARDQRIKDAQLSMAYRGCRKIFLSQNRDLDQTLTWTTCLLAMMAARGQELKYAFESFSNLGGAEVLEGVEDAVDQVAGRALELLDSQPITPGEYDCVCDPETTGMIVHEAFGHGVEMDMFVKDRALGKSYIDQYVASELITMHDGSTVDQTATMFFDDEGSLTGDTVVIDKGVLKTGMCDALSAARLGQKPTGNGRRESYERKAYTRMTNTYFEPGSHSLEEMIASIPYGFLLQQPMSGMEDPKNWGIQAMVAIAREIKDGRLTGKVFSPIVLTGYVPDLLKSVTMTGRELALSGSGFCGKGYKEWVKVSDGGPCMKARIRLG